MGLFNQKELETIEKLNSQINDLNAQIITLKSKLHPDYKTLDNLKKEQQEYSLKIQGQKDAYSKNAEIYKKLLDTIERKKVELQKLDEKIIKTNEELIVQEYGLYVPNYKLMHSTKYKGELEKIRNEEKKLILDNKATKINTNIQIDGDMKKGQKMTKDFSKLLIKNFNIECDDIIDRVTAFNYEQSLKRIEKSAEQISKLGTILQISISHDFIVLKKKECVISFNYALAKQVEKEEMQRIREEYKERQKVEEEIRAQKRKMEKEEKQYNNALKDIAEKIKRAKEDNELLQELLKKQQELKESLKKVEDEKNDVNFREAHPKAGYVYIISNIGSFGEDVYKIGCTRRLEPMDRVSELSGAAVPFKFDVHALIFSEDAFALENALHKAFANKRINLENNRKEFFKVSLDEIKKEVAANFDKTVEFIDVAEAIEYRASLKKKEMIKQGISFDFDNTNTYNTNNINEDFDED